DAVRCNHVALVFDRASLREHTEVFVTWKRPRRRNKESADVLLGGVFSVHLWKPEIVTDAKTKAQIAEREARESVARRKARLFFYRRNRIQMSLAIFRSALAQGIHKNLGVVN